MTEPPNNHYSLVKLRSRRITSDDHLFFARLHLSLADLEEENLLLKEENLLLKE
ncbi:hypothetical protein [Lyngbya aestuarii]|uniref:hypothetical protein n=1 Tax=Lyngbya aestuarii TaxID=118322 RepID=UPI00137A5591|nr:hypothetical protein [Lyngbya aestuarii]